MDVRFWFWYVRKNVRRYVRKHVERYVRKNVRRYVRKSVKRFVRKNVKRYVRKMSERMSEDMSERMSEDISEDLSERMSKDMSERTSEDCFQSVCEVESNRTHFRRWVVCLPSPDPIRPTWVRWMRQPVWVVQERNIVTKAHLTSITKPRKPEINVFKFSILPIIFSMTTLTWQPPPNMSWWGSLEVK